VGPVVFVELFVEIVVVAAAAVVVVVVVVARACTGW
jgi:hypothetical protein